MSIPAGWSRTRVFISGCGPVFTIRLNNPIQNVVFANVVASSTSSPLVAIEGLNHSSASTLDASGNASRFNYFAHIPSVTPTDTPRFPNNAIGNTVAELNVMWLTYAGVANAAISLSTVTTLEIELWSYNN